MGEKDICLIFFHGTGSKLYATFATFMAKCHLQFSNATDYASANQGASNI